MATPGKADKFDMIVGVLEGIARTVAPLVGRIASAVGNLAVGGVKSVAAPVAPLVGIATAAAGGTPAGVKGPGGPGSAGLAKTLSGGAGAIGELLSSLTQLTNLIKSFVGAISPGAVQAFNQTLADVQATIGSGLLSALNILTENFRQIGGVLLPVVQQMEPVFRALAETVGNQLMGVVKLLAVGFEVLAPILQVIADLEQEYSKFLLDLVSIIVAVVRVAKDLLVGVFGDGSMKDVFKSFFDVIRQAVKSLITFAATLAVFAGFRDTVSAFGAALAKEAKDKDAAAGGLKAAATNPQVTDVASILRSQQLAAFNAAGGGAVKEKTDTEWLKEIAASLKDTASTKKSFQEALADWWENEVVGGGGLLGKVLNLADAIIFRISAVFNKYFP